MNKETRLAELINSLGAPVRTSHTTSVVVNLPPLNGVSAFDWLLPHEEVEADDFQNALHCATYLLVEPCDDACPCGDFGPVWVRRLLGHYSLTPIEHYVAALWLSRRGREDRLVVDEQNCHYQFDETRIGLVDGRVVIPDGVYDYGQVNPVELLGRSYGSVRISDPDVVRITMRARCNAPLPQQELATNIALALGAGWVERGDGVMIDSATQRKIMQDVLTKRQPHWATKDLLVPRWLTRAQFDLHVPPIPGRWTMPLRKAFFRQLQQTIFKKDYFTCEPNS